MYTPMPVGRLPFTQQKPSTRLDPLVAINRAKVNRGDGVWKPDGLFLKFLEAVRNNFEHKSGRAMMSLDSNKPNTTEC
jgi:hypothetical protein